MGGRPFTYYRRIHLPCPVDLADLLVSPIVSTRQSFFYLASLAEKQGFVVNQTLRMPGPAWQCGKGVYMFYLTSLRQMR